LESKQGRSRFDWQWQTLSTPLPCADPQTLQTLQNPNPRGPKIPKPAEGMQQPMPMQPQAPAMTPAAGITTEQIQKVPPFAPHFLPSQF